jgi:molybdopterin/thiamine biosynthesis adenylyltransferase
VKGLVECMEKDIIEAMTEITIADNDTVELNQEHYQNFTIEDMGENKAKALARRYIVVQALPERIDRREQLKGYDLFVLCVDNERVRDLVIRYAHEYKKEFLDLRATGKRVFCMPKLILLENNLRFVELSDKGNYSCQEPEDLRNNRIQRGHRITAEIGVQMILNLIRGQNNRIIMFSV